MSEPRRAGDRAYLRLRSEIIDWELPPGTVLGEVEQSQRLGVSRTPVREALARLQAEGLVAAHKGRGLTVTDISLDNIRELFELRQPLETQAARLAARRGDPTVFAALAAEFAAVETLLETDDPARHGYYAVVERLDLAIDDAVGNGYLQSALLTLRTHLVRVRRLARHDPQRLVDAAREHRLIVEAIATGDEELAAAATQVHLHAALASMTARATPAAPASTPAKTA